MNKIIEKKEILKSVINFVKKHDNICIIPVIGILVAMNSYNADLKIGDELWCFGNITKLYNGAQIYRQCNIIDTPIFFFIGTIIFKMFGNNFFVFRTYNLIIFTVLLEQIYILIKSLNISKGRAVVYTCSVYLVLRSLIAGGANYNILAIIFVISAILVLIKVENKLLRNILQGVFLFLIFATKQNIGVFYIIGIIAYNIICGVCYNECKLYLKTILTQLSIALALLLMFFTYLVSTNNLQYFISYAVIGIGEFGRKNILIGENMIWLLLLEIAIITVGFIVINAKKSGKIIINNKQSKNLLLLFIISISLLPMQYPIFNFYHIVMEYMILILPVFAFLEMTVMQLIGGNVSKIIKIVVCIGIIVCICVGNINIFKYIRNIYKNNLEYSNIYYGANLTEEQIEDNRQICNYIIDKKEEGVDVKIISVWAMFYGNTLKLNNGDFDMPLIRKFR